MSFFEGDDDCMATLDEALAFIDSLDSSAAVSQSEDENTTGNSPSLHTHISEDTKIAEQKKKKRKRGNLSSSTRLQQRKKAELLYLRRHVQELEERVKNLKTANHRLRTTSPDTESNWVRLVEIQYQERLRSEEMNRVLKETMASQLQVSDSLRGILQKQASFQDMDRVHVDSLATYCVPHVKLTEHEDITVATSDCAMRHTCIILDESAKINEFNMITYPQDAESYMLSV